MKRVVLILLVAAGCGGGDRTPAMMMSSSSSSSSSAAAKAAAPGKCETFVATWCGRAADCWTQIDPSFPRTELLAECRSAIKSELDCGGAVGVSDSFDRCLRDMAEMTCTAVTADPPLLPASCNGAILVP